MTTFHTATVGTTADTFGRQKPVRVLVALRISYLTDESTSLERQLADAREYIAKKVTQGLNWVEVGVARDAHVSATKQHPMDRAELGHWLKERAPEFESESRITKRFYSWPRRIGSLDSTLIWPHSRT
ncbi:hypothetical protein ABZY09_06995 [Streptomyces sp. NPDC002928]|uniref:hypothetical protein n=1 Tax=Streptomyces sp. NPDC002928 TaxID=3154440 RepID=UPI0033A788E1